MDCSKSIELSIVPQEHLEEISLFNAERPYFTQLSQNNLLRDYIRNNKRPLPLINIVKNILKFKEGQGQINDVYGILEMPYIDIEYWDGYFGFYADSFKSYSRESKRLFFFLGDEKKANIFCKQLLEGEIVGDSDTKILPTYLGYLIFRPISSFVISRSAIKFNKRHPDISGEQFLTVKQTCRANLCTTKLELETAEFIQQDPNLGCCATAAIWVASHLMHERFNTNRHEFRIISNQAVGSYSASTNPLYNALNGEGGGLSGDQIACALEATGVRTIIYSTRHESEAMVAFSRIRHNIYSFVESGIPVIICIGDKEKRMGHAVVAIGHALPSKIEEKCVILAKEFTDAESISDHHILMSNVVNLYFVHDDSHSPFRDFEFTDWEDPKQQKISNGDTEQKIFAKSKNLNPDGESNPYQEYTVDKAIVPVPPMVKIDALEPLRVLLTRFDEVILKNLEEVSENGNEFKNVKFLWRSLLVEGSEFKQSLKKRGYSIFLRKQYSKLHLPKYIWLYEVSCVEEGELDSWNGLQSTNRRIMGEFLFDATSSKYDVFLLAERFLNFYQDNNISKEDIALYKNEKPHTYKCFTRE